MATKFPGLSGTAGMFVPTTNIFDQAQIESLDTNSPAFRQLLVRLYQDVGLIGKLLNIKDSGYYPQMEFVNGQKWFPNPDKSSATPVSAQDRQVFRRVYNIGALAVGSNTIPHGIEIGAGGYTFTRIYGTISDITNNEFIPIPYASNTANASVSILVNATSIVIFYGAAVPIAAPDVCYVVLEYIKT